MNTSGSINRFIVANFITYLGNDIQILGAAYVSFNTTGSIFSIGGVFLAYAIPQVWSSYYTYALIKRFGVKKVCVYSDYYRTVLLLVLGLAVYADVWVLVLTYSITVISSILDSYYQPCSNSFFQRIARKESEEAGKSSSNLETSIQVAMLLSVTLGAYLADRIGIHLVFMINSASFLASAVILSTISISKDVSIEENVTAKNPIRLYISTINQYRTEVFNFSLARIIPNVMNTLTIYFVIRTLDKSFTTLGFVDAIASIGFGLGAWLYPLLSKKYGNEITMTVSLVCTSIMILLQPHADLLWLGFTFSLATLFFGISRVSARVAIIKGLSDEVSDLVYASANILGIIVAIFLTIIICYTELYASIQASYALVGLFLLLISIFICRSVRTQNLHGSISSKI